MRLHQLWALIVTIAGLSLPTGQAWAQAKPADAGFYLGGSAGVAEHDLDTNPLGLAGFAVVTRDERDGSWKIFGGYQWSRNWAVEVGYLDLGISRFTGTAGGAPAFANVDVTGWTGSLVGIMPIGESFALFGKVGAFYAKQKVTTSFAAIVPVVDDRTTDWTAGFGATWNFTRNFSMRGEVEHLRANAGDSINFLSLGFQVKF